MILLLYITVFILRTVFIRCSLGVYYILAPQAGAFIHSCRFFNFIIRGRRVYILAAHSLRIFQLS